MGRKIIFCSSQGDIPKPLPPKIQNIPPANADWSIRPVDRLKYDELFETLNPANGVISGNNVRRVLMDSKLPVDTLSKIWDLADQDRDGNLDRHEFVVVSIGLVSITHLITIA